MSLRRLALPLLVCLVAVWAFAPPASAGTRTPHRHGHARCLPIVATGVGQDLGGGRTTATLSVHGVEVGTTAAAFTVTGQEGTVASFTGPITFTGRGGTLTAQVSGTLDLATGVFASTSTSVSGTGRFRRVTGDVTLNGTEDVATGAFTETITGELCVTHGR